MAKYLRWHPQDKRTVYNLKRTLQIVSPSARFEAFLEGGGRLSAGRGPPHFCAFASHSKFLAHDLQAHDIIEKKCIQEVTDERTGKPPCPIALFFEDYFFRIFGHLAK